MPLSKEKLATLAHKRTAGGALMFNKENKLLIVKPTYKDFWKLVGGMSNAYETPRETCIREVKEETTLDVRLLTLLCTDYYSDKEKEDEEIVFFFLAETLSDEEVSSIQLPEEELEDYKFVTKEEALEMVGGTEGKLLPYCFEAIEHSTVFYLEKGEPLL